MTKSTRCILSRLNEIIGTGETRVRGKKVHCEHVLPRSPSAAALAEAGVSAQDAQVLCTRVGNLTLVLGKINQKISNGPFSAKLPELKKSEIALNKSVVTKSKWGAEEIEQRSEELARAACVAWPWPGKVAGTS